MLLAFLFVSGSLNAAVESTMQDPLTSPEPADTAAEEDTVTFNRLSQLAYSREPAYSFMNNRKIRSLQYRSINDLLALQNGVVEVQSSGLTANSRALHVRGGQQYENGYYINGIDVTDPITGIYTGSFSTFALANLSLYSGYMPASFGNANSSIIRMETMSGTDNFTSYADALSDNSAGSDFDQNWYTVSAGGAIPGISKGRFFGLIERRWFGDRNPSWITSAALPGGPDRLPNNSLGSWAYHGRLDIDFNDRMSVNAHLDGSNSRWSEYQHTYLFNIEHTPYHEDDNLAIGGTFRHELKEKRTSYELSASYFKSERFRGDGLYRRDLFAYGRPNGNPGIGSAIGSARLFWSFDNSVTATVYDTIIVDGQPRVFAVTGDESHVFSDYLKHKSVVLGLNGQLEHKFTDRDRTTIGFEFKRSTIRFYENFAPTDVFSGTQGFGFDAVSRYGYDAEGNESNGEDWRNDVRNPSELALFAESRIDFATVSIEAGLRLDVFDYDALALRNLRLPLDPDSLGFDTILTNDGKTQTLEREDLVAVEKFVRLAPRLSAVLPLSDKIQFRFSFGIYYQRPPLQFIQNDYRFLERKIQTGGFFVTFGEPSLEPLKSTLFEAGIDFQISTDIDLSLDAYIKDFEGLISTFNQPSQPTSFATFRNFEDNEIKGIELNLDAKTGDHTRINIGYSLSDASGSSPFGQGNVAFVNAFPSTDQRPLDYDQRHRLIGIFEADFRDNGKSSNKSIGILDGVLFSVVARVASGLPYTPITVINESTLGPLAPTATGPLNSERMDWTFSVDFNLERTFSLGSLQLTPYLWVRNAFDKLNVADVWNSSGQPNTTGWLQTQEGQNFAQNFSTPDATGLTGEQSLKLKEQLPINYWSPRQVYLGIKAGF